MSYLEQALERKLRLEVKARGGLALKFVSPGRVGVPDRLVLIPEGRVYFVELKAPGKSMSPKQVKIATVFGQLGHQVWVLDRLEKVEVFIKEVFGP